MIQLGFNNNIDLASEQLPKMSSKGLSNVKSADEFSTAIRNSNGLLILVHFNAPWAPQCQQITDVLNDLITSEGSNLLSSVKFVAVEAEAVPEVAVKYNITAVPTCVFIKDGKEVERVNGASVAELNKKLHQLAPPPNDSTTINQVQPLSERLKALINTAPVMIFIKGSPEQPQCGFSRTLVQILKEQNAKYKSFDILQNEEVRQGLKEYSNWPTYPQVYINGELIGGLDIVKELVSSGELKEMLPKDEANGGTLEERLKALVGREEVMLFMKGSPAQPKCGFSKTITAILNETGVKYGHFDILEDEEVRQGLKTFSNWPTFPQLYVKGELIGGLDIVKELKESGELESTLKGQ